VQEKWKAGLKLNQKVEFIMPDHTAASSMIQDFIEKREAMANAGSGPDSDSDGLGILVSVPVQNGKERLLDVEIPYKILVYGSDRIYALRVSVCRYAVDEVPLYCLSVVSFLGDIQRRQNVRIAVNLPVRFHEIEQRSKLNSNALIQSLPMVEGWITDLSAGGIKLNTGSRLSNGHRILISFELDSETVSVAGVVKHRALTTATHSREYSYGIQFESLPVKLQDKIAHYVFAKLRHNRRLELK
jgi:c-di-GMP-binding flagellar brake protein YcgR